MIFWFLLIAVAMGVARVTLRKRSLSVFDRGCAGRAWREIFPLASKQQIREFLGLFIDSFGLPTRMRLAFRPEDRMLDVYRALYVPGEPDGFEFEAWSLELEKRYHLRLESFRRDDLTLREVFSRALQESI